MLISILVGILASLVAYMVNRKRKEEKKIGFYVAIIIGVSVLSFVVMNNTMYQTEITNREMITGEPKF